MLDNSAIGGNIMAIHDANAEAIAGVVNSFSNVLAGLTSANIILT